METTYREWEKKRQEQSRGRRAASRRKSGGKTVLGTRERRRLLQLVVCVVLFLVVFIGKGVFPDKVEAVREQLLSTLHSDTDFRGCLCQLGPLHLRGGAGIGYPGRVVGRCVWRRDGDRLRRTDAGAGAYASGAECLSQRISAACHAGIPLAERRRNTVGAGRAGAYAPSPSPEPTPTPEPAVEHMAYDGPALPDNATMDKYNLKVLGVTETVTPALGWISSDFGWREHPVDGGEKFHNGVDLGVNSGTDVLAFADGTVDYIGESEIYGQYLQLRHTGGLTTFYAHCSELLVQQGQTVKAGERVALSGATGNSTGPHLHFEMKLNGVLLNPAYYINPA